MRSAAEVTAMAATPLAVVVQYCESQVHDHNSWPPFHIHCVQDKEEVMTSTSTCPVIVAPAACSGHPAPRSPVERRHEEITRASNGQINNSKLHRVIDESSTTSSLLLFHVITKENYRTFSTPFQCRYLSWNCDFD